MRDPSIVLAVLRDRGERGLPINRVYRILYNPELFLRAYGNIYGNPGALTPGSDPDDTVDGMSLRRIEKIIKKLRDGTFEWQTVRRAHIPKRDGGKRPLGVPNWTDKLLQAALKMILEAYYEPQFSTHSHGFRPRRGCHTALAEIHRTFAGTNWFVEGDIKGCFDNIDHKILVNVLARDVHDSRFVGLIAKLLKAGYMEDWKYNKTYSGTPQGGVISPILSNIFLHQLDQFVETVLLPTYNKGKRRKSNPAYGKFTTRSRTAYEKGNLEEARYWRQVSRNLPSQDPRDPEFRRLRYVRYTDDFILGFIGSKAEAREIRKQVADFLSSIGLELSFEKTKITHARTDKALFLGYEIRIMQCNTQRSKRKSGSSMRSINGKVWFGVPRVVARNAIRRYTRKGKVIHRPELLVDTPFSIVHNYQAVFRGIAEYYAMAYNRSRVLSRLKYVMGTSLAKTLAAKLDISVTNVFRRYSTTRHIDGAQRKILSIKVPREGKPPLETHWGGISLARKTRVYIQDTPPQSWSKRTELVERLLADTCEICGSHEIIQVHHIRALKDLDRPGKRARTEVEKRMAARRRKTMVLCRHCHNLTHQGLL